LIFVLCCIDGKNKPIGEIVDFFRRVEFQLRGTPHIHLLACVKPDGIKPEDIVSEVLEIQKKVTDLLTRTITAKLTQTSDTAEYEYYGYDEEELQISSEEMQVGCSTHINFKTIVH